MNRQSWSQQEDQAISKLVGQFGFNDWTQIAVKLKETYNINKRTGKQCRERWYNHLNPAVNKKPWGIQEEELLFELHKIHGNRWKDISRQFIGRTDNDIKNHFYSTLRRSLRRLNKILGEKNSTSQMREIKPSVLSTIMNYLYEQQDGIQNDLYLSLRDLPSLIFEFANFKPIKTNLKFAKVVDAKQKIADIFQLINRFNEEYQKTKSIRLNTKQLKRSASRKDTSSTINSVCPEVKEEIIEGEAEPIVFHPHNQHKNFDTSRQGSSQEFERENMLIDEDYIVKKEQVDASQAQQKVDICEAPLLRNKFSIDEDDLVLQQMQDIQEPSMLSKQGECLDLTVFGHHWEPQSWEKEAEMKQFVDQVLEFNYEHTHHQI